MAESLDMRKYIRNREPLDYSPLHWATYLGMLFSFSLVNLPARDNVIEFLLDQNKVDQATAKPTGRFDINTRTRNGDTSLHICAKRYCFF